MKIMIIEKAMVRFPFLKKRTKTVCHLYHLFLVTPLIYLIVWEGEHTSQKSNRLNVDMLKFVSHT